MDAYSALTSWSLFAVVVGAGCWYYWPAGQHPKRNAARDDRTQHSGRKGKNDGEARGRSIRRMTSEDAMGSGAEKVPNLSEIAARKRKAQAPKQPQQQPQQTTVTPQVYVEDEGENEADRQWAQRMAQTQKGAELGGASKKERKVKTIKQSSAINTPEMTAQPSPQAGSEADDDHSPVATPMLDSGDVNDMLEPVASGPSVLRVTAPTQPQKERAPKKAKQEEVETKKQRQNRQKVEERRIQREADEKERKALEEKQRRAAREARGEPARNGIPIAKAPAQSPWSQQQQQAGAQVNGNNAAPQTNSNSNQPMLDTFDAESSASDVGPSTTATSTTDGEHGSLSYEDQLAQAKRNSEDDGWTTVALPKKTKKPAEDQAPAKPALSNKTNVAKAAPTTNGKPKGFQALYVPDETSNGTDPNDPSSWDA